MDTNATEATKNDVRGRFGADLAYELRNEAQELSTHFDDIQADSRDAVDVMYCAADEIERLRATNHQAFMNGAAIVLHELIRAYDQPTMAKNIIKSLGLEAVDFQDCDPADHRAIRSAANG